MEDIGGINRRFSRQLRLRGIGISGQTALARSRVLVLGVGAVGSVCAVYLARMGVGRIGIVDPDVVEEHNLHRQVMYSCRDVGRRKVPTLCERLHEAGLHVTVDAYEVSADSDLLARIGDEYDVVVDAMDDPQAKLQANDYCLKAPRPFVTAGVGAYAGQVLTVNSGRGPCLRCLALGPRGTRPQKPLPVFAPLAGLVACVQAAEVIKVLLSIGTPLAGRLLLVGACDWSIAVVPLGRRGHCPACGDR